VVGVSGGFDGETVGLLLFDAGLRGELMEVLESVVAVVVAGAAQRVGEFVDGDVSEGSCGGEAGDELARRLGERIWPAGEAATDGVAAEIVDAVDELLALAGGFGVRDGFANGPRPGAAAVGCGFPAGAVDGDVADEGVPSSLKERFGGSGDEAGLERCVGVVAGAAVDLVSANVLGAGQQRVGAVAGGEAFLGELREGLAAGVQCGRAGEVV
jgi:hypothetical protein